MAYDIKITGGSIVDGSGQPRYVGDVGIADGRISALGEALDRAKWTIKGTGKMISPGFIDIHTHYDLRRADHVGQRWHWLVGGRPQPNGLSVLARR